MKLIVIFLSFFFSFLSAQTATPFVITRSEQAQSVNTLKEQMGENLKKAINEVAELTERLAKMQLEASALQKKLLSQGEKLIENKGAYCKATKKELISASRALESLTKSLADSCLHVSSDEQHLTKKYEQVALFAHEIPQTTST